jgi:hypothetical protein
MHKNNTKNFNENNRNSGRILNSGLILNSGFLEFYEFSSDFLSVAHILFVLFRCPTVSNVTDAVYVLKWKRLLGKYSWTIWRIMMEYAFRAKENKK